MASQGAAPAPRCDPESVFWPDSFGARGFDAVLTAAEAGLRAAHTTTSVLAQARS